MSYVDSATGAVPHYVLIVTSGGGSGSGQSAGEQVLVPLDFTSQPGSTCNLEDVVPGVLVEVRGATTMQGVLQVRSPGMTGCLQVVVAALTLSLLSPERQN